jgi:hypothetical protein
MYDLNNRSLCGREVSKCSVGNSTGSVGWMQLNQSSRQWPAFTSTVGFCLRMEFVEEMLNYQLLKKHMLPLSKIKVKAKFPRA